MRLFCLVFLLVNLNVFAYEFEVSVSVDINKKSDHTVRQQAKFKVKEKTIDRLPLILSGKETLINGKFSSQIKALSMGQIDVNVLSEQWDRQNNTYTMVATGSLDKENTLTMVEGVKDNLALQERLGNAYKVIDKLAGAYDDKSYFEVQLELIQIKRSILVRESLSASIKARKDYIEEARRLYEEYHQNEILKNIVMTVDYVTEYRVFVTFSGGENVHERFSRGTPLDIAMDNANKFYDEHLKGTYNGSDFCITYRGHIVQKYIYTYKSKNDGSKYGYFYMDKLSEDKRKHKYDNLKGGLKDLKLVKKKSREPSFGIKHYENDDTLSNIENIIRIKKCSVLRLH